jgi:hypothetical protein
MGLHHLTSPGCRSGHYQTRVYPAPESPQALGFVTQSQSRCTPGTGAPTRASYWGLVR